MELVHRWDTPLVNLALAEVGSVPNSGTGRDADPGTSGPLPADPRMRVTGHIGLHVTASTSEKSPC